MANLFLFFSSKLSSLYNMHVRAGHKCAPDCVLRFNRTKITQPLDPIKELLYLAHNSVNSSIPVWVTEAKIHVGQLSQSLAGS